MTATEETQTSKHALCVNGGLGCGPKSATAGAELRESMQSWPRHGKALTCWRDEEPVQCGACTSSRITSHSSIRAGLPILLQKTHIDSGSAALLWERWLLA